MSLIRCCARTIISHFCYGLSFFQKREGIIILMYHRVNDDLPPDELVVSTRRFRAQMQYLAEHYDVIGIEDLVDLYSSNKFPVPSKRKKVVITFDDGFLDNFENAYPILKEFRLPATIFLATGLIGTDKKMARYQDRPNRDMMRWDEVQTMRKDRITFGAHTVTHPKLSQLNYEEQKQEIGKSIDTLHAQLKSELSRNIFCYPYGDYNSDTLAVMKELGVKVAPTVKPGINHQHVNPIELKRTLINGRDTMHDFKLKLSGAFDWLHEQIQKRK